MGKKCDLSDFDPFSIKKAGSEPDLEPILCVSTAKEQFASLEPRTTYIRA